MSCINHILDYEYVKAKPRFHYWCYFSEGEESVVKSIANNRKNPP